MTFIRKLNIKFKMCNYCNEKNNKVSPEDISISKALYLDDIYVEFHVLEHVIENAKHVGLISKVAGEDDDNHKWVVSMAKHHMLILKLQDIAKEKPYSPMGMACLEGYIQLIVRKVCKVLADTLTRYYPTNR
ncbi:hypothetical protein NDJ59_18425 [Vibrio parahaemolyticus]|uniref:Uncharacterized protein n=1 Tax=Vibrio parahaemolyticus TaxID=670 RepID=A0AAW3IRB9_VIBPH|nr:hypothetical protein [Vibrio parahaemolyticus]KOY26727.1 hypothetical protein ACX05_19540 [Vibrio parahaemolyticus]MCS0102215.1 hypothetical protein [Vibrio parahaemolyticus]OTW21134.1 hypothetical protein BA745_16245 [Vibrio parahaemolyticus]